MYARSNTNYQRTLQVIETIS